MLFGGGLCVINSDLDVFLGVGWIGRVLLRFVLFACFFFFFVLCVLC